MKFKHKIRQPKKAKKVTLARIRDIVREEIVAAMPKQLDAGFVAVQPIPAKDSPQVAAGSLRPLTKVSPPPQFSIKSANANPQTPLPDGYETEENGA